MYTFQQKNINETLVGKIPIPEGYPKTKLTEKNNRFWRDCNFKTVRRKRIVKRTSGSCRKQRVL